MSEIELLQSKMQQRKNLEADLKKRFQFAKHGAPQLYARKGFSEVGHFRITFKQLLLITAICEHHLNVKNYPVRSIIEL